MKCQSGKAPGEIKTKLIGELVNAQDGSVVVPAVDIAGASHGRVLKYKCGGKKPIVVTGHVLGEITPLNTETTELTETFEEGVESAPGCGTQKLQLIEGISACQHLELEPEPAANKKPTTTKESTKKEYVGHVSLLK